MVKTMFYYFGSARTSRFGFVCRLMNMFMRVICSRKKSVFFSVVLMVPDDALTLIYFRIKRLKRKRYFNENL